MQQKEKTRKVLKYRNSVIALSWIVPEALVSFSNLLSKIGFWKCRKRIVLADMVFDILRVKNINVVFFLCQNALFYQFLLSNNMETKATIFHFFFLDPRNWLALILFQMVSNMLLSWKRNDWKQIIESNVDFQGENVFSEQNGHTFLTKIWHNWLFVNAENVFLFAKKKHKNLNFD